MLMEGDNGTLPLDVDNSSGRVINGIGDSKSSELLVSGRTGGSTMDHLGGDDVVLRRYKARKVKRTVDGGNALGVCTESSRKRIQGKINKGGVVSGVCETVSYPTTGNSSGLELSIWYLLTRGRMIKIDEKLKPTAGLRRGKWYPEEETYATHLISEFKKGVLPLKDGTTLRTFLSRLLNCDPMRISKKFVGRNCVGKLTYKRKTGYMNKSCDEYYYLMLQKLTELEIKFVKRISIHSSKRSLSFLKTTSELISIPEVEYDEREEMSSPGVLADDSSNSRKRQQQPQSHLMPPNFIVPVSDTVNDPEIDALDSEEDSCVPKISQGNPHERQYMEGLHLLGMREDENVNFETGQSEPVPSSIGSPLVNKEDWSHKSNECDGDEIAFRFVGDRCEPDSNMKEFFLSSHDTRMVPVESAQAVGIAERTTPLVLRDV